jgi:hypothetical protein
MRESAVIDVAEVCDRSQMQLQFNGKQPFSESDELAAPRIHCFVASWKCRVHPALITANAIG